MDSQQRPTPDPTLSDPASTAEDAPEDVGPNDPATLAVRASLAHGLRDLLLHEPAVRHGEAAAVHAMRKASRRLRSDLRTLGPMLYGTWAQPLVEGLRWLGQALGAVRDLDVLRARLVERSSEFREGLDPILAALDARHRVASHELGEVLEGERFWTLLQQLSGATKCPPLEDEANEPCRDALPPLVRRAWRKLRNRACALDASTGPDAELHEIRIRAKRLRHAAELAAEILDSSSARRLARRAAEIQDLLGAHQDAVVARAWILEIAKSGRDGPQLQYAAGRLVERQDQTIREAREHFPKLWTKIDRKALLTWMR
jgi:CHAD domain-containing protein